MLFRVCLIVSYKESNLLENVIVYWALLKIPIPAWFKNCRLPLHVFGVSLLLRYDAACFDTFMSLNKTQNCQQNPMFYFTNIYVPNQNNLSSNKIRHFFKETSFGKNESKYGTTYMGRNFQSKYVASFILSSWCQFHQHFYLRIFHTNIVSAAFSSYVLALAKNSYEKHPHKTLMKCTDGPLHHLVSEIQTAETTKRFLKFVKKSKGGQIIFSFSYIGIL